MTRAFDPYARVFTEHAADRIGCTYHKAVFREYTDDSFRTLKPRPAELEHMGLLGPVIRAEVGDTIKVVFRNNASFPFSLHPHGVAYTRDSEGAMYGDGMDHPEADGLVPPGKTHVYTWFAREQAGPGPQDGSSVVWIYHSHNYEPKDVNAGLIGPIVITRRGMARPDGSPKDIDHEFFALFMIVDENQSQYLEQNVRAHVPDPAKLNRLELVPEDPDGNADLPLGRGFALSNLKFTINGYMYGNGPIMTMRKGEHVRWVEFRIEPKSALDGKTLTEAGFSQPIGYQLLSISRKGEDLTLAPDLRLHGEDLLSMSAPADDVAGLWAVIGLVPAYGNLPSKERYLNQLVEVVVSPETPAVGRLMSEIPLPGSPYRLRVVERIARRPGTAGPAWRLSLAGRGCHDT